jgi:hypothetical protein
VFTFPVMEKTLMPDSPDISIIIPVLNKADPINELISHIHSLDRGKETEIIAVYSPIHS